MTDAERWPHVAADLQQLRDAVGALRADVLVEGGALLDEWQPVITRPTFLPAAHNLACYLALRRRDLRPLQQRLAVRGLSSLGRSEAHVLATLDALFALLVSATDPGASDALAFPSRVTFAAGRAAIAREAETLFGLFRKCLS
jgi:pyruvate kinase